MNVLVDSMMAARLSDCVRSAGVFGLSAYAQEIGVPVACWVYLDSPTLAEAGSLHSRILSSELRSFLPELVAYGYRRTDLEGIIEGCLDEVSPYAPSKLAMNALWLSTPLNNSQTTSTAILLLTFGLLRTSVRAAKSRCGIERSCYLFTAARINTKHKHCCNLSCVIMGAIAYSSRTSIFEHPLIGAFPLTFRN